MTEEDELMTLTMTRAVFPFFKEFLEKATRIDGEDEVTVEVKEGPSGVITLWTTVRRRNIDERQ